MEHYSSKWKEETYRFFFFLLKITTFHNIPVKTYPHKSQNVSKGVVRRKELYLCTIEEIKKDGFQLKKKEGKTIETNTYVMTFNTSKLPAKNKVGYTMERVEQFVPYPLRCYKCPKYRHHEDACSGREVCGKCGQKDPDHHMNECEFPNKCANCGGDHPVYARSWEIWRREKEILSIKY